MNYLIILLIVLGVIIVFLLIGINYLINERKRKDKVIADKERIIGEKIELIENSKEAHRKELLIHRDDAVKRSRSVLEGKISEQLVPYFPDFKYEPSDCKFLGSPIDFVVFKGLSTGVVEEVIFLEIKTGKSKLSSRETELKKAIEDKKITWEMHQINLKAEEKNGKET